ncbi:MAG TPA: hypothetical protein VIV40_36200, partial [Kofleriaceae bacterium]
MMCGGAIHPYTSNVKIASRPPRSISSRSAGRGITCSVHVIAIVHEPRLNGELRRNAMRSSRAELSMKDRRWLKHELVDVRHVIEAAIVILGTWLILGWSFDRAITQVDGSVLVVPYMQSVLQAGASWSDHLYRFGVIGGSKMHEFGGTMPIVELCALLGLSVTMTVNVLTLFVQLCFGVLGLKMVQSLVNTWSATPRPLDAFERITV